MNISLKPEHEHFIRSQIGTGQYTSSDEVINAAFKLLAAREQQISELRRQIVVGTEQIAKGQVTDGEIVFDRLQAKIDRTDNLQFENYTGSFRFGNTDKNFTRRDLC